LVDVTVDSIQESTLRLGNNFSYRTHWHACRHQYSPLTMAYVCTTPTPYFLLLLCGCLHLGDQLTTIITVMFPLALGLHFKFCKQPPVYTCVSSQSGMPTSCQSASISARGVDHTGSFLHKLIIAYFRQTGWLSLTTHMIQARANKQQMAGTSGSVDLWLPVQAPHIAQAAGKQDHTSLHRPLVVVRCCGGGGCGVAGTCQPIMPERIRCGARSPAS
jgi:hypothetical protein